MSKIIAAVSSPGRRPSPFLDVGRGYLVVQVDVVDGHRNSTLMSPQTIGATVL
jgi:hypothetical protein